MQWTNKVWKAFEQRDRPISAAVAVLGFAVAFISLVVAALQAGLLFSQRATPYTTAVYVRQLEVGGDFAGAARQQSMRLTNIVRACGTYYAPGKNPGDYPVQSKEYGAGMQALTNAYAATLVNFPSRDHAVATNIYNANRTLFSEVIEQAADCVQFQKIYYETETGARVHDLNQQTDQMIASLRSQLAVDRLSSDTPVEEARKLGYALKP